MDLIELGGRRFRIDRASRDDVGPIVALLRDDPVGVQRETGSEQDYLAAFDRTAAGRRVRDCYSAPREASAPPPGGSTSGWGTSPRTWG